ncbi:hypothetical protein BJY52DRAFT_1259425 [Lactarius psammicola]|nr:hypothetical protein BJY52DRAFT_1259425 [Lactarius psammicola]
MTKDTTRLALLRCAVQTHTTLSRGIDWHLLGPWFMMRAALFEVPLFERSQEWKLSTSTLSAGKFFRGTGPDARLPCVPDRIRSTISRWIWHQLFGIESKHPCIETSISMATFQREMKDEACTFARAHPDASTVACL